MGSIDYRKIYETNQDEWKALTREPQKYEALLAGHYSDSNHFVYELLQNAEDENATKVVFEFYKDQLVFYHDGDPFDESDVRGVSSMLMGTKDRNDAQTIGRFGMGFKSVFKYTYQPEIYSDGEAFFIKNYLLPVEIISDWDYQSVKKSLSYPDGGNLKHVPFAETKHLTKIVIPFFKRNEKGKLVSVSGQDVLGKLNSLSGEILLFLSSIRDLYWINKENGRYSHITLDHDIGDDELLTCRISGSDNGGREEIARYLRYTRVFDHREMKSAEVSVAYKLNAQARNVNEVESSPVFVYFPTRDMTDLPFLIHGSFETAVSREKLMTPSAFNTSLLDHLGDLIADSMLDLADRKLITQAFLRRVVLAAFQDEEKNGTIHGLKEKITEVFEQESIFPDRSGFYHCKDELAIAVPFQMADLQESALWRESFRPVHFFVAFNNEKDRGFNEYYTWLRDDIGIHVFDLSDWASELCKLPIQRVTNDKQDIDSLSSLYHFLSDYRESLYNTSLSFSRSGLYEIAVRDCLAKAWSRLRKAPLILNSENDLVPAYRNGSLCIYLSVSSHYRTIRPSSIVSSRVTKAHSTLFTDGFQIAEFNNFQFVKEKVIKKYIQGDNGEILFEDIDHFETEYIEDIKQILDLMDEAGDGEEVVRLLQDAYIIMVKTENGSSSFCLPQYAYVDTSDEGVDLQTYYAPVIPDVIEVGDDDDDSVLLFEKAKLDFNRFHVDTEFFKKHGISISELKKLGLITTPVREGKRADYNGKGDGYWSALGEFCPNIDIDGITDNMSFISGYPQLDLARKKSAEILKLLLSISGKLKGIIRKRKSNPYDCQEKARLISVINYYSWLFDKNGEVHAPIQMSRHDLDEELYAEASNQKEAYSVLGFVEKEEDAKADTFEMVGALDRRDKTIMFRQLARELGYDLSDITRIREPEEERDSDQFNPISWQSEEFPQRRVRNMERLIEHVRQEFYCSDPVRYQKVWRQIRTSKSPRTIRAYSLGMYINESDTQICQMCRKPAPYVNVTEIANYGIEMPQLNLCLCRNCSSRYKQFRDGIKERFKTELTKAIHEIDIFSPVEDYEISLSSDCALHFTQTHLAEIKEILSLLEQYGIPGQQGESESPTLEEKIISSPAPGAFLKEAEPASSIDQKKSRNTGIWQENSCKKHNNKKDASRLSDSAQKRRTLYFADQDRYEKKGKIMKGANVLHKSFGEGVITSIDQIYIEVSFRKVGIKQFRMPDVFTKGFLSIIG